VNEQWHGMPDASNLALGWLETGFDGVGAVFIGWMC
jgi:hypothetical protein